MLTVRGDRKGYTLLEVLVAFSILIVGLMAIAPMTVFMVKMNLHNRRWIQAKLIGERFMENIRSVQISSHILVDDGDTSDLHDMDNPDYSEFQVIGKDTFRLALNIADNHPYLGVKSVNLIVSWRDTKNPQVQKLEFYSFKTEASQ